jgi:putative flippase GtrA
VQDSEATPVRSTPLARLVSSSVVRYLIAGGLSFLVDFGLLALLHNVVGWPVWLATGVAFLVSFAFTYTIQRMFSFMSRAPHGRALVRYTILVAFNTLATVGIVSLVNTSVLGWAGGKVIATIVTTVWNYFAYRYWVFAADRRDTIVAPAGGN